MINENAKKWIDALRSGRYSQGKGRLCLNYKYCCLGVATRLYLNEHPDKSADLLEGGNLSLIVKDWLGLQNITGAYKYHHKEYVSDIHLSSLVYLNDIEEYSFEQIADFIESNPPGLFKGDTPSPPAV